MPPANDNAPRRPTRFGLFLVALITYGPFVGIIAGGRWLSTLLPDPFTSGFLTAFAAIVWLRIAEQAQAKSSLNAEGG